MNEKLQNELAELVALGKEKGLAVVDFCMQQAPDLVEQYLNLYKWKNGLFVIIGVLLVICGCIALRWSKRHEDKLDAMDSEYEKGFSYMFCCVASVALEIIGFLVFFSRLYSLGKVFVAPKIVVLE